MTAVFVSFTQFSAIVEMAESPYKTTKVDVCMPFRQSPVHVSLSSVSECCSKLCAAFEQCPLALLVVIHCLMPFTGELCVILWVVGLIASAVGTRSWEEAVR